MTTKTVNYTTEQTAQMVADYQAGMTVDAIAETLGKTVRSVVGWPATSVARCRAKAHRVGLWAPG